ncbi:MAG: efflux RND transporter periplasmic adaptor subunit [Candidatus Didemnitutus sp.]|nr:efflux RND transporter periplasmic adaptor subunit [Candidatus Didemnitutus sp.]
MHSISSRRVRGAFFLLPPAAALLVAGLLLAGCGKPATAPAAAPAAEVIAATLHPETVTLTRELPGRTAAYVIAEVRPQVSGIVKRRLFTEGANVTAGQVLYEIDDSTPRADLGSAKAALARARAAAELARLNAARASALAETDAVSRQDYESAVATHQQAQAEILAAEAAVARAEVTLSYTRVTSPIAGRIGKSSVTEGALVTANQAGALATVQQLAPIYVDVTQSSREWLELRRELDAGTLSRTETPVTIMLEDGTRYAHPGKLEFTEVAVDPATGAIALRITVPNPDNLLLPGMYVRAVIGTAVREQAVLVPQQGIARDPRGNTTAMIVSAEGMVELRPVHVSRTIGDQWLVESGLAAGDRVIVQGLQKIRPGMPVKAVEATAASAQPARH